MSNSTTIDALLTAVDQATRPFKTLQTANVSLSDSVKATERNLRGLYEQIAQIDGLTRTQSALTGVSQQLKVAKESTQALAFELKKIDQPGQKQITALGKARDNVNALQQQHDSLRQSVKSQRQILQQAGISTRAPAAAKQRLQSSINDTTGQLNDQRTALAQENRQNRVAKIQAGQQSLTNIAGKVSAVGNGGMSIAKTGINLGKKLLQPGYEASLNQVPDAASASTGSAVATAQSSGGNLGTDLQALQAVYQSLSVDIFSTQESSLRQLVQTATEYLGQLQQWVQNNQGLVQTFGTIATVVIGVAGAIGTVASVIAPVFTGISALITIATTVGSVFTTVFSAIGMAIAAVGWPVTLVVAAIVAGAALIYANWEKIVGLFLRVRDLFNSVKEKLGFGNTQSAEPQSAVDNATAAGGGTFDYVQPTSSMPGFTNYQAARPAASNSFTDQSRTDINVTLQGDVSPGSDNSRHLMDLLEQHESNKRDNALSQFNALGGYAS